MSADVLFLDIVHPNVWKEVEAMGYHCIDAHKIDSEHLAPYLQNVTGIIIRHRIQLNEALLSQAPLLKWVGRSGVGLDAIDMEYCQSRGIQVLNGAGGNADAVGEHVLGMLLNLLNHLKRADNEVRQGIWRREANRGRELGSLCLGIIGYGNTGRSLAKKISGFGTEVIAYDKYRKVDGPFATEASLEVLHEQCDIISLHIPLNEETQDYFDHAFLDRMKKPFYLVNASRGGVCALSAVAEGIRSKQIIAAALDVLPEEPKDEGTLTKGNKALEELLRSDRILFSPHIAGWTEESYYKLAQVLTDGIRKTST